MKGFISPLPWHLALLILSLTSHVAESAEIRRRDGVFRTEKVQPLVTPAPHLGRRDQTACPTSYSLCGPNLGGGCCENGYSCAVDSCFATTAGPVTCLGQVGYHACGADVGGGCCPVGSICERGSRCIPAPGVSYSHECGASSFLCPQSLGYGCCQNGLACGKDRCFATDPVTNVFTRTTTTTGADGPETVTTTVTTVSTPGASETGETTVDSQFYKFYPTAVDKVQPIITEDDDNGDGKGGLTKGQLGGVVAGAIILLIIVVIAAWLIIRRLNRVAKAVEEQKPDGPDDRRETLEYPQKGTPESESLRTSAASRSRHRSGTTDSDYSEGGPSLFGLSTPSTFGAWSRRHSNRSSASSSAGRTISSWTRSNSHRSVNGRSPGIDGAGTPVSSLSEPAELEAKNTPAELSGDPAPITPITPELSGEGVPAGKKARAAGEGQGHGHKRSISTAPQLDVVSEDEGEMHGYYGPLDKMVGQTAARASEDAAPTKAAASSGQPKIVASVAGSLREM
ncbi:uncharacterized protein DNG_06230 [Cephalotrichum gorgonifer]|uniref:Uncharacterized protein n=1 Tax=Cephalotrichum gorgonifer TaxID=2041049 RepID=A0AAE8MZL3_9PEZI|nr:uncharacterized protein DNG_06230 [Cephalotrichum gorgonifer]